MKMVKIGNIYNKLTVLSQSGVDHKQYKLWLCQCECGNKKIVRSIRLTQNITKSCGCIRKIGILKSRFRHKSKKINKIKTTKQIIRTIWCAMKARCYNKNNENYKNYGGRGISICERWLLFDNFYIDMHDLYKSGLSIERINNDGNYIKSNCKWIPTNEQSKNSRQVRKFTISGVTQNIHDWAKEFGMNRATLQYRLNKKKMSIEDALGMLNYCRS